MPLTSTVGSHSFCSSWPAHHVHLSQLTMLTQAQSNEVKPWIERVSPEKSFPSVKLIFSGAGHSNGKFFLCRIYPVVKSVPRKADFFGACFSPQW